jgi:hypothetical protein
MQTIYQVTIHGRTLESRDLRKLLARAVSEKKNMDSRIRLRSNLIRNNAAMRQPCAANA